MIRHSWSYNARNESQPHKTPPHPSKPGQAQPQDQSEVLPGLVTGLESAGQYWGHGGESYL